jgi:hypothetical protein
MINFLTCIPAFVSTCIGGSQRQVFANQQLDNGTIHKLTGFASKGILEIKGSKNTLCTYPKSTIWQNLSASVTKNRHNRLACGSKKVDFRNL